MTEWFVEALHEGYGQRLSIDEVLYRDKTDLQDLIIFRNRVFGRVLALDGVVQTTEGDEHVYHEMLAHLPIMAHGAVRQVAIIGGGDGGMAREVLKHEAVERVTMVEIDRGVVDLCSEHLPSLSNGAFDDPRLDLVITDGARFVHETDRRFDVIIVDSTDPIGPGEVLFRQAFYEGCRKCLTPGGIVVTQNGVPSVQGDEVTTSFRRLGAVFEDVWFTVAPVPTYQGGFMAFGWATDDAALRRQDTATIAARFEPLGIATKYYNADIHVAAFALPNGIKGLLR
jgi:spermidine synthase